MSEKKEKTAQSIHAGSNARLIGAFMLGAIGLVVMVFLVFGGGEFFKAKSKYVIYFRGSVDGLNTGAPVKIRGVQIGSVTDIHPMMNEKGDFQVEVFIQTVGGTIRQAMSEGALESKEHGIDDLIARGLRAQLQSQSFVVSQKMIVVDYYPNSEAIFAKINTQFPEIPSIPTKSEELEQSLQNFAKEIGQVPLSNISKSMLSTFNGVDTFFRSMRLQPVFDNLSRNADAVGALATRMDSLGRTVSTGVNTTTNNAATSLKHFDDLIKRLENLSIENQYMLRETLDQITLAARSMKSLMDYLQQHPSDILYGK